MQKEILPGISAVPPTLEAPAKENAPEPPPPTVPGKKTVKHEPERFSAPPPPTPIIQSTKKPSDNKKPLLIGVLAVLIIFVGMKLLRNSPTSEPAPEPVIETEMATETVTVEEPAKEQVLTPAPKAATVEVKTDQPENQDTAAGQEVKPGEEVIEWPPLSLTALMGKGTKGSARINGELLGVGDEIEGVVFKAVGNNGVYLEYKGKTRFLKRGQTLF